MQPAYGLNFRSKACTMIDHITNFILIYGLSLVRYFFIAGAAFAIFYLYFSKKSPKNKIQQRIAQKKDFIREIVNSIISSVPLTGIAYLMLFTPLKEYTFVYEDMNAYPVVWLFISWALCLIIHDTYFYWMHRLLHHKKLFNLMHLEHHKSVNPSPFASYSFHFLEAITEGLIVVVLVFVLPLHPVVLYAFVLSSFIINVYGHLGYEIMPRKLRNSFWFEIINTSTHHNLHHSKFKGNYGLYFRWWDRLMKTEHPDYVKEYDRVQAQRFSTHTSPAD